MTTIANLCLIAAALLPIVCAGIAKKPGFGKRRRDGGYDNHDPRAWLARQQGVSARANAAQANGFEALPLFIAGVLAAQQQGAAQGTVDLISTAFVLVRIAYIGCYLADREKARSLVWVLGLGLCISLFFV